MSIRHATSRDGKKLHFYYNYSANPVSVTDSYGARSELITDGTVKAGQQLDLQPWGVIVVHES